LPLSLVLSTAVARSRKRLQHKSPVTSTEDPIQDTPFMAEAIGMLTPAQVAVVAAQVEVALLLPELRILEATHLPLGSSELLRQSLKSSQWRQIAREMGTRRQVRC
jgi:hypothetical protein